MWWDGFDILFPGSGGMKGAGGNFIPTRNELSDMLSVLWVMQGEFGEPVAIPVLMKIKGVE